MKLTRLFKACLIGVTLLVVPAAQAAPPSAGAAVPVAASAGAERVNINTADAPSMAASLRGIGLRKAEAIVAYRAEHGPFKAIDDLVNVKGIGAKTLEQLRPQLSL